jgi:hypothetical protein
MVGRANGVTNHETNRQKHLSFSAIVSSFIVGLAIKSTYGIEFTQRLLDPGRISVSSRRPTNSERYGRWWMMGSWET